MVVYNFERLKFIPYQLCLTFLSSINIVCPSSTQYPQSSFNPLWLHKRNTFVPFCARALLDQNINNDMKDHTNEKPFHCLHCTSSFVRRDLLQRHCRTVHHTNLNPSTLPSNKSLKNPTTNPLDLSNNEGTTTTTKTGNRKTTATKTVLRMTKVQTRTLL